MYIGSLIILFTVSGCATAPVMPANLQKAATTIGYRVVKWDSLADLFYDFSE